MNLPQFTGLFFFFLVNIIQTEISRAREKPKQVPWVLSSLSKLDLTPEFLRPKIFHGLKKNLTMIYMPPKILKGREIARKDFWYGL